MKQCLSGLVLLVMAQFMTGCVVTAATSSKANGDYIHNLHLEKITKATIFYDNTLALCFAGNYRYDIDFMPKTSKDDLVLSIYMSEGKTGVIELVDYSCFDYMESLNIEGEELAVYTVDLDKVKCWSPCEGVSWVMDRNSKVVAKGFVTREDDGANRTPWESRLLVDIRKKYYRENAIYAVKSYKNNYSLYYSFNNDLYEIKIRSGVYKEGNSVWYAFYPVAVVTDVVLFPFIAVGAILSIGSGSHAGK